MADRRRAAKERTTARDDRAAHRAILRA